MSRLQGRVPQGAARYKWRLDQRIYEPQTGWKRGVPGLLLCGLLAGSAFGADNTVVFDTQDPGVYKGLAEWGLDTAWLSGDNVRRGVNYMGQPQTDLIRFSFTGDWALTNGLLSAEAQAEFDQRMSIVDTYCDVHTALYLNNDTDDWVTNPYLVTPYQDGVDAYLWAELIDVTVQACEAAGRTVLSVAPFNEPDYGTWHGDVTREGDVCWQLRNTFGADFAGINLYGGSTLNNDNAAYWYDTLNAWDYLEEGNTHQLAGSFDTYAAFYQDIEANGDVGVNDELHNVMEAMVGAEYGMDVGIWWGSAERARGEFVKASDGDRLGYAENRSKWTAASVYRAPDGAVKAFVGESERQAVPTTYRFVAKDRPVFFDGVGPQRVFDVTTTGDPNYGYQAVDQHNAERVVNITWGDDVQPAIDGRYYLVNRNSGKVMEVAGGSLQDWAAIQQNTYSGAAYQQWDVTPLLPTYMGDYVGGDYSYLTLKNVNSGEAASLDRNWSVDYGYGDGAGIWQWLGGDGAIWEQQYYLEYVEDGWFKIHTRWSNKCVGIEGGSTGDGAAVLQWADNGSYDQQWRLVPVTADPTDFTAPAAPTGVSATANTASVQLTWNANSEGDLGGYEVLRSTTFGGPYDIIARGVAVNSYTDNAANQGGPYYYVVKAADQSLNRSANSAEVSAAPTGGAALVAEYGFESDLTDATGNGNDAVANGTTSYAAGQVGASSLVLDGTSGYVELPADVANFDQLTIAGWVYWNGGSTWQRLFDFGNGTDEFLFLTPNSGSGMQFSIFQNGAGNDLYAPALAVGEWTHVAVTLNNTTATLYVNGASVDSSSTFALKPSDIHPVINYIGKSQFDGDALFDGQIDDFRVYNYALSAADVAVMGDMIPPAAPTGLGATAGNNSVSLDWADNGESDLASYTVYRSTTSGSGYVSIASGLVSSDYVDNTAINGTSYYYVVTATDMVSNESTVSAEVSATPVAPQLPYGGTGWALPGVVEAEDYDTGGEGVSYHDVDASNNGGAYRTDGVDLEVCAEGGYNVGYTAAGEWLEFTVDVASAGSYDLVVRCASIYSTGAFHIEFDGVDVTGLQSVPNTGNWQTYTDVTISGVNLSAGQQVMRVYMDAGDWNLNNVSVSATPVGGVVFSDSFENGEWNGLWVQDGQNDWFASTQRATDGSFSAEVDGSASDAALTSIAIDLGGLSNATVTFDWLIEASLDSGEYLAFDVSTDGGSNWTQMAILQGDVDQEDTWHNASIDVTGISSGSLQIRFRGTMNRSNEDADVDNVVVTSW